ncbi:oxidoreductase of aldo/keto reductase family, subgroup 1 [Brachybacterium faecium]|uniref:Aldo/keto reductase, diketogulonate reductase n=1 Tax=Brachybacterium faecium (strain ATCC 43885 / DSM 4810 / JCM 11609 / LMG 19847 / NBRC 14762 / NCIMB 9860 / 6-10) TaxID=446465 RepID=C7MF64_BRAFD|nr:aldo/keto reductase [Brachybacterium faecium]ACU83964.1 aldo/keto reductase, diketogulonate reductase [Brachybacterium faecium DSM 4810]SLM90860.1 oxidoreductase of aldo/keto reductase family, subgroup 1 [Brachybacterium faecium]
MTVPSVPFHDGAAVPQLGYGVWQVEDDVAADVVAQAILAGYRHIDTAAGYQNEGGVGRAVKNAGIPREDLFITTKLANGDQGFDSAKEALETSLAKLDMDYVDLYLIHWASPQRGKYLESWKALIELQKEGKAKSIGVSNFPREQLEEIIAETGVVPVMHQIELHPDFQQRALREYHAEQGILTEAWSPLGQGGDILQNPVITEIAEAHGVDAGQVIIAWHLAIGNVVIPKTVTPARIVSNVAAADLELTAQEVEKINALDRPDGRIGADPANPGF